MKKEISKKNKGKSLYFLDKIPISMRLIVILLFGIMMTAKAETTYSQKVATVSLKMKDATVEEVLNQLEEKTNYHFLYNSKLINVDRKVSIEAKNEAIDKVLIRLFASTDVKFDIAGDQVILSRKEDSGQQQPTSNKKTVRGFVKDATGEPMIGVSVVEVGTKNASITDISGEFLLSVDENATLKVSYIGYLPKDVKVKGKNSVDIILEEDVNILDEFVVVGYGTQKKGNLTGAISTIKSEDILTTTHSSLAQSLQGKIAGLQIRQQTGEPGEFNTDINIRGFGGAPLYVIDGIARDGSADFQRLDPNDIESISVLKDASAAIYGFNSANGVILVTTKKGSAGAPKFSYNGSIGFQSPTNVPEMATAAQLQEMLVDANVNIGRLPHITKDELEKWKQGVPGYEGTNWYDLVMKERALQTQHNISVSGGNKAVDYFVSFGYLDEEGLVKSNDISYQRYSVRGNLTAKLSNHLTADVSLSSRYDTRKNPGDFFWIFKAAQISLPTESPYANGNPDYLAKTTFDNPVAIMERDNAGYNDTKNKVFQNSGSLTYDAPFLKGFQLKGTAAYDFGHTLGKVLKKTYNLYTHNSTTDIYKGEEQNGPAKLTNWSNDFTRLVLQGQASYKARFNDVHNVSGTLVYEQTKTDNSYTSAASYYDFLTNDQQDQASKDNQEVSGNESETANMSYVGRFNYDYAGKYLIEFAFRYDGSYRYNPDKRWDFFPVVSAGWRISEEKFMKNNLKFLDNLKFRASYGKVGENAGNPFQYVDGYSVGGGGYVFSDGSYTSGITSPSITNRNLTWYTATITDFGIDIGLFKNKLNIEFDVYQRDRDGLLTTRAMSFPNTFGADLPQENLNTDRVQGFEFMVSYKDKVDAFSYGVSMNLNYARTMNRYVEEQEFGSSYARWRSGSSDRWNDVLWGYNVIGQFQNYEEIIQAPLHEVGSLANTRQLPGSFIFEDVNGDGVIDGNDMLPSFYGGQPKLHYGITLSADYKGFDMNILFQGSGKYTVRFQEVYADMLAFNGNTPAYFYDRWHLADPYDPNSAWVPGKWPAIRTSDNSAGMYRESQMFRKDASYLRLKSVEIGYTVPKSVAKRFYVENIRLYANGHNLLTFADSFVKPFDPEKIEGSFSAGFNYPLTKSFNFGINISF